MSYQNDEFQLTSNKKYPTNKYYDFNDFSRDHLQRHCSINYETITTDARTFKTKKSHNFNSKELRSKSFVKQTPKTNASSRIKSYQSKSKPSTKQTKQAMEYMNDELKHYKKLCLELRKENTTLREDLKESKEHNKEAIQALQKKVDKLNQENNQNILNRKITSCKHGEKQGNYSKFFNNMIESFQRIQPKLKRKIKEQKTLSSKVTLSRCIMNEITSFLEQNNFKFKIAIL